MAKFTKFRLNFHNESFGVLKQKTMGSGEEQEKSNYSQRLEELYIF